MCNRNSCENKRTAAVSCSPVTPMLGGVDRCIWPTGQPHCAWHRCTVLVGLEGAWPKHINQIHFMQQPTNNDVTGSDKQATLPPTQPAQCTDPCTTTHARCGQPVGQMHGLTPPHRQDTQLHDTAAMSFIWEQEITFKQQL